MPAHHVAQVNVGILVAPLTDPQLADFVAGLDPVNARRIKDLIRRQQQAGKTIFLTTHNMAVAEELCDRVAFIVDGQVKLIDAPRALRLRYGAPMVRVERRPVAGGAEAVELAWDDPAFELAVPVEVDGVLRRVEISGGRATFDLPRGATFELALEGRVLAEPAPEAGGGG